MFIHTAETGVVSGSILTQRSPRKLFLGRFWRKSQSSELGEVSKPKLPRRGSLVSLLGRSQKLTVARASLEDICRLSGLSLIHLPPAFRATSLIIPTCLAATGNHLVEHGSLQSSDTLNKTANKFERSGKCWCVSCSWTVDCYRHALQPLRHPNA